MKFAIIKNGINPLRDKIAEEIIQKCLQHGHEISTSENGIQFVLNLTQIESPQFFRRHSQSILVFSIVATESEGKDLRSVCYTTLVRTLSNILICVTPNKNSLSSEGNSPCEIYFTTPEAGFYHFPFDPEEVYRCIIPIAGAHFAMGNQFFTDLPPRYWKTSPIVEKIKEYGKELDSLGVLPAPFPLREVLSEENIQHVYNLFELKGISYGNLSAREHIPELGKATFWMTARGINKAKISKIGKDVLLVKGFDYEQGKALVSVPPDFDPKARVSVDAVEHELIYRTFPEVGAIVHVHAWMDGVLCTRQNYPCGTQELAEEVVNLLRKTDNPLQTAVGLKNHGLTITGPSLEEIFKRIRGKLLTEVLMFK
ncbi:MAG: class II aldolase/adducin family protein [Acidobacteriota bacterium]